MGRPGLGRWEHKARILSPIYTEGFLEQNLSKYFGNLGFFLSQSNAIRTRSRSTLYSFDADVHGERRWMARQASMGTSRARNFDLTSKRVCIRGPVLEV